MLLLLSLLLSNFEIKDEDISTDYNPFLKTLPTFYIDHIEALAEQDSTFAITIEDFARRELVIFRKFPTPEEKNSDFIIDLIDPSGDSILKLELTNAAAMYNYNEVSYGIFKTALPWVEIDHISIKQKRLRKKDTIWETSLAQPFQKLEPMQLPSEGSQKDIQVVDPNFSILENILNSYGINAVPRQLKIINDSIFHSQKPLVLFIEDGQHTILTINKPLAFWNNINQKNKSVLDKIEINGTDKSKATALLEQFTNDEIQLKEVFNLDKLAYYNATLNLFAKVCDETLYFKFDETSQLFEPIYVNSNCNNKILRFVKRARIKDLDYINKYLNALNEISKVDIYEDLVKSISSFQNELRLINRYDQENIFDVGSIEMNQRAIIKSINPSTALKTELLHVDKENFTVSIVNLSSYPIEIEGLSYQAKKTITDLDMPYQILSGAKDTVNFKLPRSFENLFVSKKNKAIGFLTYKHIYDLFVRYSIQGVGNLNYSSIIPYQAEQDVANDLFRDEPKSNLNSLLSFNEEEKLITLSQKEIVINSPLIIPEGYTFKIAQGSIIDIVKGGKIVANSPLLFQGSKAHPIRFISSDKKGQGMIVLSNGKESILRFTDFDDLTNPIHGNWSLTGAITFYESPVNLFNVNIRNNRCEDALNIVRTTFVMRNCSISGTQSDAFDGDFVKGRVISSTFENLGNDAIDVSGSDLVVRDVIIKNAGDKGLSAGEDSQMKIINVKIYNSEIAIAGKDLSIVTVNDLLIDNTKLGFTAFQKKPEFGPSNITVEKLVMTEVETEYLIESSSSLFVDGKKIETSENVKDRMYGVEFGRSSAETKNNQ